MPLTLSEDRRKNPKDLCLFGGEKLEYLCLSRSGNNVATAQRRLRLSNFVDLKNLTFDSLALESAQAEELTQALRRDARRLPVQLWNAVLGAIAKARPEATEKLAALERQRTSNSPLINDNAKRIRSEERDSIGVAVEIFGLEKERILPNLAGDIDDPLTPILNVPSAVLREDQMLAHDWLTQPDWTFLREMPFGSAEFERPGEKLTVLNVNRTPIEQCLGVDLIYVHHRFQSFVMVQYKRLTQETGGFNLNDVRRSWSELKHCVGACQKLKHPNSRATTDSEWSHVSLSFVKQRSSLHQVLNSSKACMYQLTT